MHVLEVLAEQVKAQRMKPQHLLTQLKTNEKVAIGARWAQYRKVKAGEFVIEVGEVGSDKGEVVERASTPVEAKLSYVDTLVDLLPKTNGQK
jgi:hypothetical protein